MEGSNIERLTAALNRRKHDRVPNFEIIVEPRNVAQVLGLPEQDAVQSRYLPPAAAVDFARRTSQDAVVACVDAWLGGRADLRDWPDLERIKWGVPGDCRKYLAGYLDAARGTAIGVIAHMCSPFFVTYMAVGPVPIQSFMEKLADDLPFVERVMDSQLEQQLNIVEAIRGLPIAAVIVADDIAMSSGLFCAPGLMERIWIPRARRLAGAVRSLGVPLIWHCCGKLDWLLPHLLEWGVDALNPVQPSCNDIYAIHAACGDRLTLIGNISIENVLATGSPADVAADVRLHIERLAGRGSYVVASSHCIVDAIAPENYAAMIEATQRYGRCV